MDLIIGGAFQGKRDFAKEAFSLEDADIFTCSGTEIDFTKKCIDHLEEFSFACVKAGEDPISYLNANAELWQDAVMICQDIFCGVVPMGAEMRAWRNETGRMCQYLTGRAVTVRRIFCGLEQRLK